MIKWRGAVTSAITGQRGQAFLIGLAQLMDEMGDKRLIAGVLVRDGEACALGLACQALNVDTGSIEYDEDYVSEYGHEQLSAELNIAGAMVREIEFENDEAALFNETPEERWQRMRKWIDSQIIT